MSRVDGHGVDFVRDEVNLVRVAERENSSECRGGIAAAEWVVRVAENENFDFDAAIFGGL
jgi:hypothetical protein